MLRCALIIHVLFIGITTASNDVNSVFRTWLRPAESSVAAQQNSHEHIDTEFRHALEVFLYLQTRRALESFLNATPGGYQTGLLAGIATAVGKLADADAELVSEQLSSLKQLLDRVPEEFEMWPLIRRLATGGLALRYGKRGPFAPGTEEPIVQAILLQLYGQLRKSAKRKGVMEFTHVSKSGGTSFCRLAKANGCSTEDFGYANCLIKDFRDGPRYISGDVFKRMVAAKSGLKVTDRCSRGFKFTYPRSNEASCVDRRSRLLERGYSMYAVEYTALGAASDPALAHACRNMYTVLELRHPHGRVWSHLKHMWFLYKFHCGLEARAALFSGNHNTSVWSALMPAPTNNYLVRSLLGEAVFNSPSGAVTRAHLDLARNFLAEQYDVVLVLEDKPLFRQAAQFGLGWGKDEKHANSRPEGEDSKEGLPQDPEALWRLNALDVELYQFGSAMSRLDAIMYGAAELVLGAIEDGTAGAAALVSFSSSSPGSGGSEAAAEAEAGAEAEGDGGRSRSSRRLFKRGGRKGGKEQRRNAAVPSAGKTDGGLPACGWVGAAR